MSAGVVTEALAQDLHRTTRSATKDVAVGVYGQSVIVRKITVPMMTNEELDEQISWEAEQHIPFDIKVMSVDYEVLRRRPEAGQMDLLLVAAKKDEINDYASILREAKLRPMVVDINAFTIQNIFETQHGLPDDGTIGLLNVGAAVSSLNIVSKGVSAFTREITNAGNAITEEIQKQCGVPYEQAEAYKCGGGPTQIVPSGSPPGHQPGLRHASRRNPAVARLLPRHQRRQRDQPHLRLGRQRLPRTVAEGDREAGPRAGGRLRSAWGPSRSTRG